MMTSHRQTMTLFGGLLLSLGVGGAVALAAPAAPSTSDSTVEALHSDAVGTVRLVTDETGAVVESRTPGPFGEARSAEPLTEPGTPTFAGKRRDATSGLAAFGARDYSATLGRFTSVDPANFLSKTLTAPQDFNLYSYGRNNPFTYGDPTGRAARRNDGQADFDAMAPVIRDKCVANGEEMQHWTAEELASESWLEFARIPVRLALDLQFARAAGTALVRGPLALWRGGAGIVNWFRTVNAPLYAQGPRFLDTAEILSSITRTSVAADDLIVLQSGDDIMLLTRSGLQSEEQGASMADWLAREDTLVANQQARTLEGGRPLLTETPLEALDHRPLDWGWERGDMPAVRGWMALGGEEVPSPNAPDPRAGPLGSWDRSLANE